MDIIQTSNKYLNTLYQMSKKDLSGGCSEATISKLLGLESTDARNIKAYLTDKRLVDAQNGFGDNIHLTSYGVDYAIKLRENKIYKTIKFKGFRILPTLRDAVEFVFPYEIIDDSGASEEKVIKVAISGSLSPGWGIGVWEKHPDEAYRNLAKMLLQVGKDRIIEKLKEGTLSDSEELMLMTTTHPHTPPYNPVNLIEPENAVFEVQVGEKNLSEEIQENKLAASIIERRDIINAIFYERNKEKLLLLNEERNLLDFFKTAKTEEEYSHRISSLAEVARLINMPILRKLTKPTDPDLKSVSLLELFLQSVDCPNTKIINTLRQLGKIRQGYPAHTDIAGVIKAYKHFGLQYPVKDYEDTWITLLNHYLFALNELYEILADIYLSKRE